MLLQKMQKKVKVIMWATLILVIPSFVMWGIGAGKSAKKNLVAKVDGRSITLTHFTKVYQMLYTHYASLYRDLEQEEFEAKIKELNLEQQAFNLLVENVLVQKEIKKRRIKVSDEEVAEVIKKLPFFLTAEGNFDKERFEQVMQNFPSAKWRVQEEGIRSSIAFEKLKKEITSQAGEDKEKNEIYAKWLADLKKEAKIDKRHLPKLGD